MILVRKVFMTAAPFFLAAVLLHGCATSKTARPADPALRSVAGELSKLEGMIDFWGTASISEVLFMEDNGQFKLDYDQKVSDYVEKARAAYQGAARRFFQKVEETQTATTTEVDAVQAAKAAMTGGPQGAAALDLAATAAGQLGVKGLGPDTAESYGIGEVMKSAPAIESKLQPNAAKGVLASDRFSAPYALADAPIGISERQAFMIGANDKITENMIKFLAHPTGVPENKIVLVGIMQVSCNPGAGTREGYMADMLITPEYDHYKTAGTRSSLAEYYQHGEPGVQPLILAAFPLLEAQTLDLRNSEREQKALSTYIASLIRAQGQSEQNESLTSMAERLENDAATRSPVPTVVSYTNGDSFGFQFMPRFEALVAPEKKDKGSGKILYPYSFPALILIAIDRDDLQSEPGGALTFDAIRLGVTTRWVPIENSKFGCKPTFDSNTRLAMAEKLEAITWEYNRLVPDWNAREAERSRNYQYALANKTTPPYVAPNFVKTEMDRRLRAVEPRALGKSVYSPFPSSLKDKLAKKPVAVGEPKITYIHADRGWLNAPTLVAVTGNNLTQDKVSIVKSVIVGGRACEYVPSGGSTLLVIIPPFAGADLACATSETPCVHKLTLVTTKGVDSAELKFSGMQSVEPGKDPAIKITRSNGEITAISVNQSGVLAPGLLAVYRDILTNNKGVTLHGAKVILEEK